MCGIYTFYASNNVLPVRKLKRIRINALKMFVGYLMMSIADAKLYSLKITSTIYDVAYYYYTR